MICELNEQTLIKTPLLIYYFRPMGGLIDKNIMLLNMSYDVFNKMILCSLDEMNSRWATGIHVS
jgi:hypothetical protein